MSSNSGGFSMNTTLGLDIGSNSVGWALVDTESQQIVGAGVRIFPEGVNRDTKMLEKPKNQERRTARGMRRQIARRARRKQLVRAALVEAGWWTENDGFTPTRDPLELRTRGLDQRLSLAEFGQALLHLAQRRGFLSNRKTDHGDEKEKSEILAEISTLQNDIEASGARTLGEYLHRLKTTAENPLRVKVRGRHTRRAMYLMEFEALWAKQSEFHPELAEQSLKYGTQGQRIYPQQPEPLKNKRSGNTRLKQYGFHGLLFFQRALYWPKSTVGRCELEPRQPRCERGDRMAQRYRLLNEVGNLRVIPWKQDSRELNPEERRVLLDYLAERKEATFVQLKDQIELSDKDVFNLEAGGRTKLVGMPIDHAMSQKKLWGKDWKKLPDDLRNSIIRILIDESEDVIRTMAVESWGCSHETAERLAAFDPAVLVPGHASLSRRAIEKLLPHLEAGLPLVSKDGTKSALAAAGYLRPDQRQFKPLRQLPLPTSNITNPLVRQALVEVRKVVNGVIREWGMPTSIHVELAREVQGSALQRKERSLQMRDREKRRDDAANKIRQLGYSVTREAIERYLLWCEQAEICLYSGRPISPQQLFGGEVQIDHILPYSHSLDNSLMNKAVVFQSENSAKGNQTVWQWLGKTDPTRYDEILLRGRKLPHEVRHRKLAKLLTQEVRIDDFLNRQLTDTAYTTTQVLSLLRRLENVDVVAVKGQLTADLRHMWGLDTILRDDGLRLKNRDDHRHHAVDALVIALTDRSRLQQLARVRFSAQPVLDPPWMGFRNDAEDAINRINVSHRPRKRVSGPLHEETVYGRAIPTDPTIGQLSVDTARPNAVAEFVYRKALEDLKGNMIKEIRDLSVRKAVEQRLRAHGLDPATTKDIPKEVWKEPLYLSPQGRAPSSKSAIIKRIRLVKRDETIRAVGSKSGCVKPGNTHHIAIFELADSKTNKTRRVMASVTLLEAARRITAGEPVISRTHPDFPTARFLFSLSKGEMVLTTVKNKTDLFVYRTSASTQGQIYLVRHYDAREPKLSQSAVTANTLVGTKVTIDPIGRIRRSND
jgi:CRISPR-associated endonuclease Csn1